MGTAAGVRKLEPGSEDPDPVQVPGCRVSLGSGMEVNLGYLYKEDIPLRVRNRNGKSGEVWKNN